MPSWEDLDNHKKPEAKPDEFAELCARVFTSRDGEKVLEMLRTMTIEADLPQGRGENALWELEGQRKLVRRIQRATQKGLDQLK